MPQEVYHNIHESTLPHLETICTSVNGAFTKAKDANGKYSAVCNYPDPGAASQPTEVSLATATPMPATVKPPAVAASAPAKRTADLSLLHPVVRSKVIAIQKALDDEGIPLRVFESFRHPQRQRDLFNQGNGVTNADAWESYHQYGLAADFVLFINGNWSWSTAKFEERQAWDRYHEIAREAGLEPLSWEKPHVQLVGTSLAELRNGVYPPGGDDSWADNLAEAISSWTGGDAPPLPDGAERPASNPLAVPLSNSNGLTWHNRFGGDEWAYDNRGVYTRHASGGLKLWRSVGAPITAQEILARFEAPIFGAASKYDVPPALIVMTIATETAHLRNVGFTGPKSFRWEQGYTVKFTGDTDLDGKEKGDYSAGPMQVLSDTARWMNEVADLGYDVGKHFAFFRNKPKPDEVEIGLMDVNVCIDVGTAYIRHNMTKTENDPLLVAAAYNAGGLYPSTENHWRMRSYGNHIDRAAEWYGDACAVLNG